MRVRKWRLGRVCCHLLVGGAVSARECRVFQSTRGGRCRRRGAACGAEVLAVPRHARAPRVLPGHTSPRGVSGGFVVRRVSLPVGFPVTGRGKHFSHVADQGHRPCTTHAHVQSAQAVAPGVLWSGTEPHPGSSCLRNCLPRPLRLRSPFCGPASRRPPPRPPVCRRAGLAAGGPPWCKAAVIGEVRVAAVSGSLSCVTHSARPRG